MSKLDATYFTGTLAMDSDCCIVNIWLKDNEERIFRRHFNKEFADLVYQQTPPADLADFIAGFFAAFRRVLFAEYQKQKNAITAANLASEVSPSLGGVGVNFKAQVCEVGNDGADNCNNFVLSYDFGTYDVKFIPFKHSNIYGV
ncbi:MAG: hypothetical protein IIX13_09300 [Bacteroidales bacterium]|nr:hypothetical protein [Bacteroidales bacterium]